MSDGPCVEDRPLLSRASRWPVRHLDWALPTITLAVDGAGRIDPGACSAERSPVGLGTLIPQSPVDLAPVHGDLLVTTRARAQDVKRVVTGLQEEGRSSLT